MEDRFSIRADTEILNEHIPIVLNAECTLYRKIKGTGSYEFGPDFDQQLSLSTLSIHSVIETQNPKLYQCIMQITKKYLESDKFEQDLHDYISKNRSCAIRYVNYDHIQEDNENGNIEAEYTKTICHFPLTINLKLSEQTMKSQDITIRYIDELIWAFVMSDSNRYELQRISGLQYSIANKM